MGCCHRSPVKVHNEYQQGDPRLSGRPYAKPSKPQQCNHDLNSKLHYHKNYQQHSIVGISERADKHMAYITTNFNI